MLFSLIWIIGPILPRSEIYNQHANQCLATRGYNYKLHPQWIKLLANKFRLAELSEICLQTLCFTSHCPVILEVHIQALVQSCRAKEENKRERRAGYKVKKPPGSPIRLTKLCKAMK